MEKILDKLYQIILINRKIKNSIILKRNFEDIIWKKYLI